jgi:hypothetical protein
MRRSSLPAGRRASLTGTGDQGYAYRRLNRFVATLCPAQLLAVA